MLESQLVAAINKMRRQGGLPALTVAPTMKAIAEHRATIMSQHGRNYAGYDVIKDMRNAGLCVRKPREQSYADPMQDDINALVDSTSTYRDLILDPAFTLVGIGVVYVQYPGGFNTYVASDFLQLCPGSRGNSHRTPQQTQIKVPNASTVSATPGGAVTLPGDVICHAGPCRIKYTARLGNKPAAAATTQLVRNGRAVRVEFRLTRGALSLLKRHTPLAIKVAILVTNSHPAGASKIVSVRIRAA
jgi:hypothetical protein